MANHGYVKTRRKIRPEIITDLLKKMNDSFFKGNLEIKIEFETSWHLYYISNNRTWAYRYCWLEKPNRFEMRHGGGGYFAWWIDTAILNEVAILVNGTIHDDSDSIKSSGVSEKYSTLDKYLTCIYSNRNIRDDLFKELINIELELTPPEFHEYVLRVKNN